MNLGSEAYKGFDIYKGLDETVWRLFVNRKDTYAVQQTDGTYKRVDAALTEDVVKQHLEGKLTVGLYQLNPINDTVLWLCWDIDPTKVPNPAQVAKSIYNYATEGFPKNAVWLEASRWPDESFHVWVFFICPVPAEVARWIGEDINNKAGHPNVEVFPKQDTAKGRFGNLVKLPLGLHREHNKWSKWLNPDTLQPLPNEAFKEAYPATIPKQQLAKVEGLLKEAKRKRLNHYVHAAKLDVAGLDLNAVPCVKAFQATPIPPSYRHMAPCKNFAILYWQMRKTWEGFTEWAEWLAQNQPDFRAADITGWLSWVLQEPRKLNCGEIIGFLKGYIPSFSCEGCKVEGVERLASREEKVIRLGDYILELKGCSAVVFDKNGEPIWSAKITTLSSQRTKKQLAEKLKLEESIVDQAVAKFIVQTAEQPTPPKPEAKPTPQETVEKAKTLLRDPKLLCQIIHALRSSGLVGETRNALTCFFDMLSAKTANPINRRWSGRSGIGKTTIVVQVASLFPPEMVMMLSGATKKTLWYHPDVVEIDNTTRELSLDGKILILLEESESREFLDEIKPLLSHDKRVLEYAFVEKMDGVNVTHKMRLHGWPAYIGVTTEPELREEQQTRALLATPDRGREKWRAVIARDAEDAASLEQSSIDDLTLTIQEAIRQLKPFKVWIPWLPVLAHLFPHDDAKAMREWRFLHSFLESIAILHQEQLPKVFVDGEPRLAAPVWILEVASKIVEATLAETIFKLPRDVEEFLDYLAQQPTKTYTYKQLQREYGKCFGGSIPLTTLKRRYIEKLVDEGLLEIDDSVKPYKINFVEKRSTNLTIFENALKIIRSDEKSRDLIQKRLTTTDARVKHLSATDSDGKPIPIDQLTNTLYSACVVDDVLKAISRRKEEEYAVSSFFSDLVKLVEAFPEGKPFSTVENPPFDTVLNPKDVVRLVRVNPPLEGTCGYCKQRKSLELWVENEEAPPDFICLDCAVSIKKQNPEVEWLE